MIKIIKHFGVIFMGWVNAIRFLFLTKINNEVELSRGVTVVITSCGRPRQLRKTLKSFLKVNTHEIQGYVFIEDANCIESINIAKRILPKDVKIIINEKNLGQLNSIDIAYRMVTTEYIFHMEEDWYFEKPNFIEDSLHILTEYPECLFFSLRANDDQNGHPLKSYKNNLLTYKVFWKGCWVGFGFNPSLRRTRDYLLLGKYGSPNDREIGIGLYYYIKGYRVLAGNKNGYIEHLGNESTEDMGYKKA
jgi:hypothetical protein